MFMSHKKEGEIHKRKAERSAVPAGEEQTPGVAEISYLTFWADKPVQQEKENPMLTGSPARVSMMYGLLTSTDI